MSNKSVKITAEPTKVENAAHDPSRGPCDMVASTRSSDEETGYSGSSGSYSDNENDILARRYRSSVASSNSGFGDLHMLTSYRPGESKVERMAKKIGAYVIIIAMFQVFSFLLATFPSFLIISCFPFFREKDPGKSGRYIQRKKTIPKAGTGYCRSQRLPHGISCQVP